MSSALYAHTPNSAGAFQLLDDHLRSVAHLAAVFSRDIGAEDAGRYVGLLHDLGKASTEFQQYLRALATSSGRARGPDHKGVGALLAAERLPLAALAIHGHHGGLQSLADVRDWVSSRRADSKTQAALAEARLRFPDLVSLPTPPLPPHVVKDARAAELFVRLLFSALVDADSLDTERHFQGAAAPRRGTYPTLASLQEKLALKHCNLARETPRTGINMLREEVLRCCLAAANSAPGIFRLAAPTGSGKTLSGMAFALRHAAQNDMRRLIVAVPFISITQQTADVYRGVLGEDAVLEHHSSAGSRPASEEDGDGEPTWADLAAENWDAPVIVTTTVQLFESLFSNSRRACRKLHRVARSVIILDEAQTLPVHLLEPITDVLKELCAYYRSTVVLCTATQPAFESLPPFAAMPAVDIVPEPSRLFAALRRVEFDWPDGERLTWNAVASKMRSRRQALAIVNTKKDAIALLGALRDKDALHLSTMLCGAHRAQVIREVKERLAANEPCRLVSTQVVEAGVDIDLPLVLRAIGPLDSIIQAAGRCNREGRLTRGQTVVFEPAEGAPLPAGAYRAGTNITRALASGRRLDLDDPASARLYFRQLYETVSTDREDIQSWRAALDYPQVARLFRMIDDDTEDVIVAFGSESEQEKIQELVMRLRNRAGSPRLLLRQLRPYMVSLRRRHAERYAARGLISPILPGVGEWHGDYHPVFGLTGDAGSDPDGLVY